MIFLSALGDVVRQGGGAAARRGGLHHQADSGRGSAGARRRRTSRASTSSASCARSRDRLDRELASAARMQRLILPPSLPAHPGRASSPRTTRPAATPAATTTTCCRSAPDRFGVMVADVSGHGAPAAIVMAMIRAALHSHPAAARRSGGGAADAQRALRVPLGHVDVRDRHLRGGGRRSAASCAGPAPAIRRRCWCARATAVRALAVDAVHAAAADAARPHPDRAA